MRRALLILFLSVQALYGQTTWYLSPTGSDSNVGTIDSPWRTLSKACGDPNVSDGDFIFAQAGSYTEVRQSELPNGVSLVGAGIDQTVFHFTYSSGPGLKLESYGRWGDVNYGNQSISYLTIDGDMIGSQAIAVNYRSNVSIHHCRIMDFVSDGIIFYGQATGTWTGTNPYEPWRTMPNAWCVGNRVYNCIITNCAAYTTSEGKGNIRYGQQDGFCVEYTTITQTSRAAGLNGYGIKFWAEGWNINTRIHDNTITVAPREYGKFNFSIENWNDYGGCRYYNNRLQGQIDFSATMDGINAGYGSWFYRNQVGFDSTPQNTEVGVTPEAGLVSNCVISENTFFNLTQAIVIQHIYPIGTEHPNTGVVNRVDIIKNLIYNIGESGILGRWTYGSICGIDISDYEYNTGNLTDSITIANNTIVASGIVRSNTYSSTGIAITGRQTLTNIFIKNNIVKGFKGATMYNAAIMAYGNMSNTNLKIEYNCLYDNVNTVLWEDHSGGLFVPGSGYSYAHNITSDPLFVGSGSYALAPGSPCIGAGTYLGITTDILGSAYNNPPSMGAYEYTSGFTRPSVTTTAISDITSTTATSGGNVTSTGGTTVTARGVCWSLTPAPTLANSYSVNGSGPGIYQSYLSGLLPATTYYVRSYATNNVGTTYGNEITFQTDPGGSVLQGRPVIYLGRPVIYNGRPVTAQ